MDVFVVHIEAGSLRLKGRKGLHENLFSPRMIPCSLLLYNKLARTATPLITNRHGSTLDPSIITGARSDHSIPQKQIFGLQDVIRNRHFNGNNSSEDFTLFPEACVQSSRDRDCTAACTDPVQIFSSLDTLHNCIIWPTIVAGNPLSQDAAKLVGSLSYEQGDQGSFSCLRNIYDNTEMFT